LALNDPDKAARMQNSAIDFVEKHFDMLQVGRELHDFYCENLSISKKKQQSMITFEA